MRLIFTPKNAALLPLAFTCLALIGCGSNTSNAKTSNNPLPALVESTPTVGGTLAAGGSITVSETTTNTGPGGASASLSRFYLNASAVEGGTLLGSRTIPALAAGAASTGSTALTLPLNLKGGYSIVACADDDGAVSESDTSNRCAAVGVTVTAADLAERVVSPTAGIAGKTLQVSDTVTDVAGSGSAGASSTQFYLNTSASKGGTPLASRSVPGLAAGNASTALTILTLPATANGQNYLIACANDTNSVAESNSANNCVISPLQVFQAGNSVFVDNSAATAADGPSCGAIVGGVTNDPCKTIAGGVTSASGNSFPAVFLAEGTTYNEQVTISNQLTLGAVGAGATIQAPPGPLTADSDNLESLITVASGASAVITNLTMEGPINNTSCGDLMYGIYVKNASATVAANVILNVATANPAGLGGCQSGIGVRFGSMALNYAATGSILSNTVSGYQKGGIVVDGPGTNVSVKGNVVTGSAWAFGVIAQNGIQISRGALGTASDNVVSNNSYGSNYCADIADGILLYDLAPGVIVTNNQVTGNDEGIGIYSDSPNSATNAAITSNTVYSNLLLGIHIDANSTGNDVWRNSIFLNPAFDEVDETGSFTSANDWGTTNPANANILGNGGVFSQKAGSLCH